MKKKMGRPAPEWLINLKPGKYSAQELSKLIGITTSSIRETLRRYGAKRTYEFNGKAIEGIFEWSGFSASQSDKS